MNEKKIKAAMDIILQSGDARLFCKKSLEEVSKFKIKEAKKEIIKAQEKITKAHKIQTNEIQEEMQGIESEYSLLFAHAQDTLMTVYSEINITKEIIKIFESYDEKLRKIEKKLDEL